jgi:hypothetical protein
VQALACYADLQLGDAALLDRFESFLVGDLRLGAPPESDRLELLGAHYRPHAGAAGQAALVVDDRRVLDQVLSRLADRHHLDALVARHFADELLRLERVLAPEVGCVTDLHFLVCHPQINGFLRSPRDDDAVIARAAHLR